MRTAKYLKPGQIAAITYLYKARHSNKEIHTRTGYSKRSIQRYDCRGYRVFVESCHVAWWGIVEEADGLFVLAVGLPDWCVCVSGVGSP